MSGQTDYGKGDRYRKVDQKKWDEGYIRAFGEVCPRCKGLGTVEVSGFLSGSCLRCNGLGYIEKEKK